METTQNTSKVKSSLVSLRNLSRADISSVLDYWYNSPSEYLESMGVDLTKLSEREVFEKTLLSKCEANEIASTPSMNALIIEYDGVPVGMHTINPLEPGNFGIFHAHLWEKSIRGRGLGMHTYPQACRIFFERFNLHRILFKTPVQNVGAIRVKEKLGIPCIGEEIIEFGVYQTGTRSRVFELTRSTADKIFSTAKLQT